MGLFPPPPQFKNSGILRYRFGALPPNGLPDPNGRPALQGGPFGVVVLNCLGGVVGGVGADAATPDMDNQLFGMTPGHPAITGTATTLFLGSNPAQRDADPVGNRVQGNPDTGTGPVGGSPAGARIPAGTKVLAWFEPSSYEPDGVAPFFPFPIVQTEVLQNRIYKAGVEDTAGPIWLSSLRVAIVNGGAANSLVAGMLYVKLQHSHIDIPGDAPQSMQNTPSPPR